MKKAEIEFEDRDVLNTGKELALTVGGASGADLQGPTLLPMLIAGLILIVAGMLGVVFIV
jgi:hypothetical protein